MTAYYNEFDPFAAAWLRELIKAGHICQGDVDERSIEDVKPSDLKGYTQRHFFAGIGVWSYALRRAGWPDDRAVWTGSCPCQPFSAAGKGAGFADERHLWPAFFHLIRECRPGTVFGEQVASKDGLGWLDLVQADLEAEKYTCGAVDMCAAGFGAPHIRQRLYWVADNSPVRRGEECQESGGESAGNRTQGRSSGPVPSVSIDGLGNNNNNPRLEGHRRSEQVHGPQGRQIEERHDSETSQSGVLAHPDGGHEGDRDLQRSGQYGFQQEDGSISSSLEHAESEQVGLSGRTRQPRGTAGFWQDCDWIPCIDGKARPVESGTFPLAHGIANRVGLLRGYGNSLVAPQAQAFIEAYLELGKA